MVTLFISHTDANTECTARLRQDFEVHGYTVWREPASILKFITSRRTIENAILSSAAVILVWSTSAAQTKTIEDDIHFAQTLKKPIFTVALDSTKLPDALISVTPMTGQPSCENAVAALMTLPNFPIPKSTDSLIKLYEQAASRLIDEREAAIDQAAEMLKRGEQREVVLALLEYLVRYDLMTDVKKKAQEVIDNDAKKVARPPQLQADDSRHIFGVRCKKGHVTYFDKRFVCSASSRIVRGTKENVVELDELHLKCEHPECGIEIIAHVDCRDYKGTK